MRLFPREANFYYNRGLLYVYSNEDDKALSDFNTSMKLNPKYAHSHHHCAALHLRQGRVEECFAILRQFIEDNPEEWNSYIVRAILHLDEDNLQDAIDDCDQASKLINIAIEKAEKFGSYLLMNNDVKALNEELTNAYLVRARAFKAAGDFENAIYNFRQAVKLLPDSPLVYSNRGHCYTLMGDHQAALDDYATARRLIAQETEPVYATGFTYTHFLEYQITAKEAVSHFINGDHEWAQALWRSLTADEPGFADLAWIERNMSWLPAFQKHVVALIATLEQPTAQTEGE